MRLGTGSAPILYVLLLCSVVIAVLGIVNTLALSVLERTRGIGLLRAIGLQRRQLGAMITIEAIATAVFGAVLGTLLGLGLRIALQRGLQSQGLNTLGTLLGQVGRWLRSLAVTGVREFPAVDDEGSPRPRVSDEGSRAERSSAPDGQQSAGSRDWGLWLPG